MMKFAVLLLLLSVFAICGESKTQSVFSSPLKSKINTKVATISASAPVALPDGAKLAIGAGGIYAAFLYYGTLQEAVFRYEASDGTKFKAAWFLQLLGMDLREL